MLISKEQVLSWYERLTFIKNEVQTEIDTTVPGTDAREKPLEKLNQALDETRLEVQRFAAASGIKLFPNE